MGKALDLTGQQFGRWYVLYKTDKRTSSGAIYWHCRCSCEAHTEKDVNGTSLKNGSSKSCGCISREINKKNIIERCKKYNTYDLSGSYGIGYTFNTKKEFYFDLDDYDKIKDYCWFERYDGYIVTNKPYIDGKNQGTLRMHRLVMDAPSNTDVDHINHKTNDNRKCNLRIVSHMDNMKNMKTKKNNTSGYTGVYFDRKKKKWYGSINANNQYYFLGYYSTLEEAYIARKQAEEKYYGEYSYNNSQEISKDNKIKEVM